MKQNILDVIETYLVTIPFAIILVIAMMLGNDKENTKKVLILYFIGSVIIGATVSGFAIEIVQSRIMELTDNGERIVTAIVTIFGFSTLVYVLQNKTVQKYVNRKIEKK